MRSIMECWTALIDAFPNSFINERDEFIAHQKSNQYIILGNCESELDIKCKVLEWFSRPAHKTAPYVQEWRNKAFHNLMLSGVNEFLGKDFSLEDMDLIYTYLGNACNHEKTIKFIQSDYDMSILI